LNVPINFINGSREIPPSFTQEWPVFSQTHQFSYTIPYAFTEDDNGMEDMRLNYRLQALTEDERTPAFAPRREVETLRGLERHAAFLIYIQSRWLRLTG
jgi:hypothetical protein